MHVLWQLQEKRLQYVKISFVINALTNVNGTVLVTEYVWDPMTDNISLASHPILLGKKKKKDILKVPQLPISINPQ